MSMPALNVGVVWYSICLITGYGRGFKPSSGIHLSQSPVNDIGLQAE